MKHICYESWLLHHQPPSPLNGNSLGGGQASASQSVSLPCVSCSIVFDGATGLFIWLALPPSAEVACLNSDSCDRAISWCLLRRSSSDDPYFRASAANTRWVAAKIIAMEG